jgi:hypothetical protein
MNPPAETLPKKTIRELVREHIDARRKERELEDRAARVKHAAVYNPQTHNVQLYEWEIQVLRRSLVMYKRNIERSENPHNVNIQGILDKLVY